MYEMECGHFKSYFEWYLMTVFTTLREEKSGYYIYIIRLYPHTHTTHPPSPSKIHPKKLTIPKILSTYYFPKFQKVRTRPLSKTTNCRTSQKSWNCKITWSTSAANLLSVHRKISYKFHKRLAVITLGIMHTFSPPYFKSLVFSKVAIEHLYSNAINIYKPSHLPHLKVTVQHLIRRPQPLTLRSAHW